jgi:Ca2+-binding RTX toxin-like protein
VRVGAQTRHGIGLALTLAVVVIVPRAEGSAAPPDGPALQLPETRIVSGPADGATLNYNTPHFTWAAVDAVAAMCVVDGIALASCASAFAKPVTDGPHSLSVAGVDAAGNVDPSPALRTFTVWTRNLPAGAFGCLAEGEIAVATSARDLHAGKPQTDVVHGGLGDDLLGGAGGRDCLYGQQGADRLFGGGGADVLIGGGGDDALVGESGDDALDGAGGRDRLSGGRGDDRLLGGAGGDRLSDAAGRDTLSGGMGNDRIDARDARAAGRDGHDTVRCGTGFDVAVVDAADRVAGDCERVYRRS